MEVTMSSTAEITVAIQNDRPSLMIRVTAQEEGNSMPDIRGMLFQIQEAITEYQAMPPAKLLSSSEVAVHDVPCALPPAEEAPLTRTETTFVQQKNTLKPETNTASSGKYHQNGKKKITPGQILTIRQNLQERRIPESTFCRNNNVERLEDMPKGVAWKIIHDHQY